MEKRQDLEWTEAQKIVISIDLIVASKKHLQFLQAVDDNGKLYDGPILERAIFRYKYCWLPLLAKHTESEIAKCRLVVPLDCEWIWHCHRLNPVRYMADCKELFGRILDAGCVVVSSVQGSCKKETEKLWNKMYPEEPYELDVEDCCDDDGKSELVTLSSTNYDLVSAVKRQSSFYYQVSRTFMKDDIFLDEAVWRYKGFLHLIRRNMEMKLKNFCVPTYDIDLLWHTHQLHPLAYRNDMMSLLGKVLDHDDRDSDRTKGQKLDVGFSGTTKQWKEMFSSRYWRAGAMYRGTTPTLVLNNGDNLTRSLEIMFVEILMEITEVRRNHKRNLVMSISKKQHDLLFTGKSQFNICFEAEETQVVMFQCEPKGELLLELTDDSSKSLGIHSMSLSESNSKLATQIWLDFDSDMSMPITIGMVVSTTPPSPIHVITKGRKHDGNGRCDITSILASEWTTGGMCSGSGGCGGQCGGGGGCHASCGGSCGGCRASCGGNCGGS